MNTRRTFMAGLGATAAWPLAAWAQQSAMPVVGVLGAAPWEKARNDGFLQGLREAGYFEGRNVALEYRWAADRLDRLPTLAAELVSRHVAAIATAGGTPVALAAKAATTTVPIVFSVAGDPITSGLVASLARPGGNITGVANLTDFIITKLVEIMNEIVPGAEPIGALVNPDNPNTGVRVRELEAAASHVRQPIRIVKATSAENFDDALAILAGERVRALVVQDDIVFVDQVARLVEASMRYALPTIMQSREFATAGGLVTYGPNRSDGMRQVGVYVGRILSGERPADLPVVQPTKFEMVVNLKSAKTLGLNIPESFLLRADEVIE